MNTPTTMTKLAGWFRLLNALDPDARERAARACEEVQQEHEELITQRNELVAALQAVISNIDVSTINNSKRSTKRWVELKEQAHAVLAKVKEGGC